MKKVLTNSKLYALFKHFDTDDSEVLTEGNIKEAFAVNGKGLSDAEMRAILRNHDTTGDGQISFDEFKGIFFDTD